MGIGLVMVVEKDKAEEVVDFINNREEEIHVDAKYTELMKDRAYIIGEVVDTHEGVEFMLNIGVLISGGGTNLQAIIDETKSGGINGTVKLVISNKENAYGLERARLSKIKAVYETDEDKIIEAIKRK